MVYWEFQRGRLATGDWRLPGTGDGRRATGDGRKGAKAQRRKGAKGKGAQACVIPSERQRVEESPSSR
jgi:hypothetical protein